jgi:transposase
MLVAVQPSRYKQARVRLLLMMGHHSRSEALFHYFRLEDQTPENHLLRLIDRHVNLEFIRAKLKDPCSDAGRPSIDSELLLRMLPVGYLYGIRSERKFWKSYACIWRGVGRSGMARLLRQLSGG